MVEFGDESRYVLLKHGAAKATVLNLMKFLLKGINVQSRVSTDRRTVFHYFDFISGSYLAFSFLWNSHVGSFSCETFALGQTGSVCFCSMRVPSLLFARTRSFSRKVRSMSSVKEYIVANAAFLFVPYKLEDLTQTVTRAPYLERAELCPFRVFPRCLLCRCWGEGCCQRSCK